MQRSNWLAYLILAAALAAPAPAAAQHTHGHGAGGGGMPMETRDVLAEGVKVTFQVMANAEHRKMLAAMKSKEEPEKGTSHNIAVVLQDTAGGKPIVDAQVKMKVIDPGGAEQVKPLRFSKAMQSYDNYFNLAAKGTYQLIVAFKTGERLRNAGVYFEVK
jgi:hypothetical protein